MSKTIDLPRGIPADEMVTRTTGVRYMCCPAHSVHLYVVFRMERGAGFEHWMSFERLPGMFNQTYETFECWVSEAGAEALKSMSHRACDRKVRFVDYSVARVHYKSTMNAMGMFARVVGGYFGNNIVQWVDK